MRISDQEANRLRILKAIRRAEPVARTDLVRLTGLAGGTITEVTAELVRRKIVIEEKVPAVGRGRPRSELRVNPEAACFVGAFLFENGAMRMDFVNLRGDTLFNRTAELPQTASFEAFADRIASAIKDAISASPFEKSVIHSVGVGLPAMIDSGAGIVHWLPFLPPGAVPFADMLRDRLRLPVFIEQNVNVMARAEHWFGEDEQLDDFSLVTLGLGLGLGRYVDGMPWNSTRGINAEFGHVKMAPAGNGRPCICGGTDCLTTYATIHGIVAAMCRLQGRALPTLDDLFAAFHGFADDARAGHPDARAIFDLAGTMLGTAVANHINMHDPARLILVATDAALIDMISASFHAAMDRSILPALQGRTRVELRVAEGDHYAQGAAALILERLYRLPPGGRKKET